MASLGNYDIDGDTRPLAGTIDVALKTAHPALAILKFHSSGSLGISLKEGNYFEAKTTTSIFVDDEGVSSIKYLRKLMIFSEYQY